MAHFAKLDGSNIVIHVSVVDNTNILDENGNESEVIGISYLKNIHGQDTVWKQTSYNKTFRKHYAGIGFKYDESRDAFIPPQPYGSWVLEEESCVWKAPIEKPNDGKEYIWFEQSNNWIEIDNGQTE